MSSSLPDCIRPDYQMTVLFNSSASQDSEEALRVIFGPQGICMTNQRSEPTLIACPACGWQVSSQAAACPRCGQPIAARHIPPQPHQSTTSHKAQKQPLTEWEDILRLLGMLMSRLRNWGSARLGTQSQKKLQPFTVTDKIKLGLLGILAFLVLALIVIVPIINDNNANRSSNVQTKQTLPLTTPKPIDTAAPTPTTDGKVTEAFQTEASRKGERIYKRIEAQVPHPRRVQLASREYQSCDSDEGMELLDQGRRKTK
jgi:hypothetical protein